MNGDDEADNSNHNAEWDTEARTSTSTSERPLPDAWLDNGEMVLN